MEHFTKAKQDLEDRREFLLLIIVKLKQMNRRKTIELKKQNKYLNKIANGLLVSKDEKLDMYASKLNNIFKNENR